jgi:hypothetical protein
MIARWINDFEKIGFMRNCRENYPKPTFLCNKIAEWLTTKRIKLSEVKVGSIDGTAILIGIWFIILLFIIYIFCWWNLTIQKPPLSNHLFNLFRDPNTMFCLL